MSATALVILSIISGSLILLQSSLSGQLSKITGNPHLSALSLYFFGFIFMLSFMVAGRVKIPDLGSLQAVPKYLWVTGSLLSVFGLTLAYWLMPILGVSKVLSGIIAGQMIGGMIVSHYGLFNLPTTEINQYKAIGAFLLLTGVILINGSFAND